MHFLVLLPTLPFPPQSNGIAVRYYPFLKSILNSGHEVTIVVFNIYNHKITDDSAEEFKKAGFTVVVTQQEEYSPFSLKSRIKAIIQLFGKHAIPFEQYKPAYHQVKRAIHQAVPAGNYDFGIGVEALFFAILCKLPPDKKPARCICDFIDSPFMHYKRKTHSRNNTFNSLLFRSIDQFIYRAWEQNLSMHSAMTLYASIKDAEAVWGPKLPAHVHIMPNGIYTPAVVPYQINKITLSKPAFGFIGNLAYQPNHEAALYLITIWHLILKEIPQANLYLIGHNPTKKLFEAARKSPSIHITGTVENVWVYYHSLDLFLCPLQSGAGIQNKILEAMFAKLPIVASSIANSGVQAIDGKHIIIANERKTFVKASVDIWKDRLKRERIVNDAHSWVKDTFNWKEITASFLNTLRQ